MSVQKTDGTVIVLELAECQYIRQIHEQLKDAFDLAEYYGENWDALWDCLDGAFDDRKNFTIRITGFYALPDELRNACMPMLEIFEELEQENGNIQVEYLP